MNRSWLLLLALFFVLGCPTPSDDDDSTGDDDDSTPPGDDDDDDSTPPPDPCAAQDASAAVGGSVTGSTIGGTDDLLGTCSSGQIADDIWVLSGAEPGTYTVTTISDLTTFDTVLFAYTDCTNPFGTELACNDDVGENVASLISFEITQAQDVYIVVEGYDGEGSYELSIERAVCGDGEVGGFEQCDGGADCDGNCEWLCADDGRENDDDPTLATPVAGAGESFADGVLCPADEGTDENLAGLAVDAFAVTVADADSFVEATLAPGGTLSTECSDLQLQLVIGDAEYGVLAGNDAEEGACPHVAAVPGAGEWYVIVYRDDVTMPPMDYQITIASGVSECGDGVRQGVEECDDDGNEGGDGCSAACRIEDATCPVESDITGTLDGSNTTGDTSGSTDAHTPSCTVSTSADLVYELTFAEDTVVGISTDHAGTAFDTVLSVREASCVDPGQEIACNDDVDGFGGNYSSAVGLRAEAGVTYYVIVDGYDADAGAFELSVTESVCQNGVVELGEECDDDNDVDGDGCEADCTTTPMCAMEKDGNLGALVAGTPATWEGDVAQDTDNLPAITCSAPGGGDRVLGFSVATAGTVTVAFDHTAADVQYAIFRADDACEQTECVDAYPDEAGQFSFAVTPGNYLLVLEAYDDATTDGSTSVTVTFN